MFGPPPRIGCWSRGIIIDTVAEKGIAGLTRKLDSSDCGGSRDSLEDFFPKRGYPRSWSASSAPKPKRQMDDNEAVLMASNRGDWKTLDELINAGADVNARDDDSWTALHEAVTYNRTMCVALLLMAGADLDDTDSEGMTAHDHAVDRGWVEVQALLRAEARRRRDVAAKLTILMPDQRGEVAALQAEVMSLSAELQRKDLELAEATEVVVAAAAAASDGGGDRLRDRKSFLSLGDVDEQQLAGFPDGGGGGEREVVDGKVRLSLHHAGKVETIYADLVSQSAPRDRNKHPPSFHLKGSINHVIFLLRPLRTCCVFYYCLSLGL